IGDRVEVGKRVVRISRDASLAVDLVQHGAVRVVVSPENAAVCPDDLDQFVVGIINVLSHVSIWVRDLRKILIAIPLLKGLVTQLIGHIGQVATAVVYVRGGVLSGGRAWNVSFR